MLVLTRKQNESVLIGNEISVKIIGIDGDKIKLGIEAPENMRVLREELIEVIGEANRMAAQSQYRLFRAESR